MAGVRGRRWLAGVALVLHAGVAAAAGPDGAMIAPRLSAAGDRLAFIRRDLEHDRVVVRGLEAEPTPPMQLFREPAGRVTGLEWIDDETLVATLRKPGSAPALQVLRLDGARRALAGTGRPAGRYAGARPLAARADGLLYASDRRLPRRPDLYLWPLWSEQPRRVVRNPGNVVRWIVDGAGRPRARLAAEPGATPPAYELQWRDRDGGWRRLHGWVFGGRAVRPFGITGDGEGLWARRIDAAGSTLVRVDAGDGELTEVAASAGRSVRGYWPSPRDARPVLVEFGGHGPPRQQALDPLWGHWQDRIDGALPESRNRIVDSSRRFDSLLVRAYSDRVPAAWYHFDTASEALEPLGRAAIPPLPDRGRQRRLALTTRDGLHLSGYYWTAPAANYPAPAVVLVHGGPWRRDRWGYNRLAQRLAGAGIVVMQLNFRGSRGFGTDLLMAGRREWGRAMQSDLAAGVKLLVRGGVVDPERVCIAGKSYGGYAALVGALRDAGRYRCAIAHAPVTDVAAHIQALASRGDELAAAEWRYMVGDPGGNARRLRRVSPLTHAESLDRPVLLSHGLRDGRVDPAQSHRFRRRAPGGKLQWLGFPAQGHDLRAPAASRRLEDAWVAFAKRWLLDESKVKGER